MRKLPHILEFGTKWEIDFNTSLSYQEDSGYYCVSIKIEQVDYRQGTTQAADACTYKTTIAIGNTYWPNLRYHIVLRYPSLNSDFMYAYSNISEFLEHLDNNEIRDIYMDMDMDQD